MKKSTLAELVRSPAALGYLAGWRLVRLFPRPFVLRLAKTASARACENGKGAEQLRKNLVRVVGAENVTQELVRNSMASYARYWVEAFQLPAISDDPALLARLDASVRGAEHLAQSVAAGRGVILTLPHSGNWDMAGMWLVRTHGRFTTVAERLKPEVLFEAFVRFRTNLGFKVVSHSPDPGKPRPVAELRSALQRGEIVALMGERDLKQSGVVVNFFGEDASFPAGPALLAIQTGAALHVVDSHFTPTGWGFGVSPAISVTNVQETTQRVADRFAENIAAHPADWHMLQPLWLADIPEKHRHQLESGTSPR